jgi:hypothetical protein
LEDNPVFLNLISAGQLADFQNWEHLAAHRMIARYHLIPSQVVFDIRASDVLVRDPDFRLDLTNKGTALTDSRTGERVEIHIPDTGLLEALIDVIKGPHSFGELLAAFPESRQEVSTICHSLLGSLITMPRTIRDLQCQLPVVELVRFPQQSPYCLPRPYWENSIAIRNGLGLLYGSAGSDAGFLQALSGLHRIATLGESGFNYYGGAGPVPTVPGRVREVEFYTVVGRPILQTLEHWLGVLRIPHVLVTRGVIRSRNDCAMAEIHDGGLRCIHIYRTDGSALLALLDEAGDELRNASQARAAGDIETMIGACARFHQLIVAAHPFNNNNNSLAMNVVNDLLTKERLGSLPHLYLDYVAQRTSPDDYMRVFEASVRKYAVRFNDERSIQNSMRSSSDLLRMAQLYTVAEFRNRTSPAARPG